MKKIIFYDCFTKGVKNVISQINEVLPDKKYAKKLLHFESIYNSHSPKVTNINNLECFDFTYYKTYDIVKILEKEKPDLIIFFDKNGLTDRAGIKAAKYLKIPSLLLQHGLMPTTLKNNSRFYQNIYSFPYYLKNTSRIIKMLRIYFVTSMGIDRSFFICRKYFNFLNKLFTNPHRFYFTYPDEVKLDKLAVYGEEDKIFFKRKDGYKDDDIKIVGNFFLDNTGKYLNSNGKSSSIKLKKALLITSPAVEDKVSGWNDSSRKYFITEIIKVLSNNNIECTIKIHPRENINNYKKIIKDMVSRTVITQDEDLNDLIFSSDIVIGTFSTALMNAVALGKKIIIINFGKSDYGELYYKWGVARAAGLTLDFDKTIKDIKSGNYIEKYKENRQNFIKNFCYKIDGLAKQRIVNLISEMLIAS